MKKLIVATALILCIVLCVFSFSSCGKKKKGAATTAQQETVATTDKWEALSPEIKAFDVEDRMLKIQISYYTDAEKTSKNDKYLAGPDEDQVKNTDTIGKLIYARNATAKELLGLDIEWIDWGDPTLGWGKQASKIVNQVQSADPSAPDMFVDMLYDLNKALLSKGVFKDIWSIPGSYFDFSAAGWMTEWMESLSFTGDRAYVLGSDFFIDFFRNMGVLPFNASLMDDNGSKLAKALFGEDLAEGETMSQRFFDYVEAGNWTWDSLKKLCEAIWVDRGTAGQNDIHDTLGIMIEAYSGMPAAIALYSSGEVFTEVNQVKDETGAVVSQTITYPSDPGALKDIFDAISGVFTSNGALVTNTAGGGSTEDAPGIGYHYIKFAENTLLFTDPSLLGTLEDDVFQQMIEHYLYSVVPLPKVSAEKNYNTVIHNTADVGAISVRTSPGKARVLSAFLQYVSENSAAIRKEFLEIVTKYKTTDYNQGTDRMLDLIYDSVITARDKALDDAVDCMPDGRPLRFHTRLKDGGGNHFTNDSSFIASEYAVIVSSKTSIVNQILAKWRELPTGDYVMPDPESSGEE
ncbi:MAG: hypothetical protein IKX66_04215 [Clostridia bacterium]|nr:hypothetical protein [Clostridia bacterium]